MPYKAKGKCVYKADTGKKVGCTKGPVSKYLAALHANVPDAKHESQAEELKTTMKIKLSEIARKVMESNKPKSIMLNGKQVDVNSIEVDGIDRSDYPDFSDAFISKAFFVDGTELSDVEVQQLESENYGLAHELAHEQFF
jgi:hypothetical protein